MSEHMHPIFDDVDAAGVCSKRQSLEEFTPQLRRHMWTILNSLNTVRSLNKMFDSGQRVWPTACNDALKSLTSIGEHGRKFQAFIEPSMHLPLVVVPLRLSLLWTLKNIELQITKLSQQLSLLRDTGKTALSQPMEERHTIVRELDVLTQYGEQAVQRAEDLLNRAKEREYSAA
jgi:hypothetical protein